MRNEIRFVLHQAQAAWADALYYLEKGDFESVRRRFHGLAKLVRDMDVEFQRSGQATPGALERVAKEAGMEVGR